MPITYRSMQPSEVTRVAEIDRSEHITLGYRREDGELKTMAVNWQVPPWLAQGAGAHTVQAQIDFLRSHLKAGGLLFGAFDGERLVGLGLMRPDLAPGQAQLAFLHVSRAYRRMGIAARLAERLEQAAGESRATEMYVSATPSESAVGFYTSRGYSPTRQVNAGLVQLEPDDIHMVKMLAGDEK